MKARLSKKAKDDLRRIGLFIAQDNPARAVSFTRELQQKAQQLRTMPRAFPIVVRYGRDGIRRRVFGDHLILYRIDGEEIVVIRILHGAQEWGEILRTGEVLPNPQ